MGADDTGAPAAVGAEAGADWEVGAAVRAALDG